MIDIHTHVGAVLSWSKYLKGWVYSSIEDLIDYMDSCNVDIAVLLATPGISKDYRLATSEKVLKLAKLYPDRIVPFCVVDPRSKHALERMKSFIRGGCMGIGELKVQMRIDDERLMEVYAVAEGYDIPVLIHMEDEKYCYDINRLERVLKEYSSVNFIMHGPGWWKHISAEVTDEVYPSGKVVPEGVVVRILEKYDNVYADISAFSGLNALKRDMDYAKIFLRRFSSRILFGTDFPCLSELGNQFGPNGDHLNLLSSLELPVDVLDAILHRNAERLLFE